MVDYKEGLKFDDNKLRYDLIPPEVLEELARIYTIGAQKYEDRNWEKGMKWGRVFGALMRHAWAWWKGEEKDKESGLSHMAHAIWNCFTLLYYEIYQDKYGVFDDRPKKEELENE